MTLLPIQVSAVETADVVLKPPGPAKMRLCPLPSVQGSINSGAVPPMPQVRSSRGLERHPGDACVILIDAIRLADDDAAIELSGPGNSLRASAIDRH